MAKLIIRFKKLTETATLPSQKFDTDAGIDICADCDLTIQPNGEAVVSTGIAWDGKGLVFEGEVNRDKFYQKNTPYLIIQSRSGLAFKSNIECSNAGVIDELYTGEIKVKLYNFGTAPFEVHRGDRIAQAVFDWKPRLRIEEVSEIENTERGTNGFGSTGIK